MVIYYIINVSHQEPPKPYQFDYGVRDDYSGANYGHQEASDGNAVQGSYQVALPDGRIQTVKYIADHKNGFQAQVEYEGEARYPEEKPHHAPQQAYHQSAPKPVVVIANNDLPQDVPIYKPAAEEPIIYSN